MLNKLFTLALIGCATIAFLGKEASAKKNKLRDGSGRFETPKKSGKETYMVINDTKGTLIVVELQLGNLGAGEHVLITDNTAMSRTTEPQSFTYTKQGNQLVVVDQSYNVRTERQVPAPSDVIKFESFTGRVFIMYLGKNTGGVVGNYQIYNQREQCTKSDLVVTSGGLICDDDLAGFATVCRGNFQCPVDFETTGTATCVMNEWRGKCLPGPSALDVLATCTSDLTNCPLDSDFLNLLKEDDDDEEAEPQADGSAGKSISTLKVWEKKCSNYCNPKRSCYNDYFPKDFNNRAAVNRYIQCARCANMLKCSFSGNTSDRVHG